jgi:hypothetical protein
MLTRLRVSGFKNLVNVDVRFGPFTCVAGANAVGKSNLFDAIRFLSALADKPLMDAALSVRDEGGRASDVRSIFHRVDDEYDNEMSFEAEMVVTNEGVDDLGQRAVASTTFLRYTIIIAFRQDDTFQSLGKLELIKEELTYIKKGDAPKHLLFQHKPAWRASAVTGAKFSPYISTEGEGQNRVIRLHQDAGGARPSTPADKKGRRNRSGGRPSSRLAAFVSLRTPLDSGGIFTENLLVVNFDH